MKFSKGDIIRGNITGVHEDKYTLEYLDIIHGAYVCDINLVDVHYHLSKYSIFDKQLKEMLNVV